MDTFLFAFNGIMPILLVIALGYFVRRVTGWEIAFFKKINKLCFRLFLPMLLFSNIYSIGDLRQLNWAGAGFMVVAIACMLVIGVIAAHLFVKRRDQRGVIIQSSFRSNQAILGLSLVESLGGQEAMVFASLSTAVVVPIFNILAVIVLTLYSGDSEKKIRPVALIKGILKNPLVISCLTGIVFVLVRQLLPLNADGHPVFSLQYSLPFLYSAILSLAKVASPLMLFCLGTVLDFGAVKGLLPQLSLGVLLRLVVCPGLVLFAAILLREPLHLTTLEFPSFLTVFASPVAVSSAVMVQEIGGDDQLAGQLVVWCTVLSMFTLFGFTCLLRVLGAL